MLDENSTNIQFLTCTMNGTTATVVPYEDSTPDKATEAYMFAPPGYWKTIKNDKKFPDDYPLDIMQSINGGTAEQKKKYIINSDVPDGDYDYYYLINDKWKKLTFTIEDKKIISINHINVSQFEDGVTYDIGYSTSNLIKFDVNPLNDDKRPIKFVIAQQTADMHHITFTIKRTVKNKGINIDFFVYKTSKIPIKLSVPNKEDKCHIIFTVPKKENGTKIHFIVKREEEDREYINFIVKRYDEFRENINFIVVYFNDKKVNFVVQRKDKSDLPIKINIQRVVEEKWNINFIVKRTVKLDITNIKFIIGKVTNERKDIHMYVIGVNDDNKKKLEEYLNTQTQIPIKLDIPEVLKDEKGIDISLQIANKTKAQIPITLIIDKYQNSFKSEISFNQGMTKTEDTRTINFSVVNRASNTRLPIYMYIFNKVQLETVADTHYRNDKHTLPITVSIINKAKNVIPITMVIHRTPELISYASFMTQGTKDTDRTITFAVRNKDTSKLPITFIYSRNPQLITQGDISLHQYHVDDEKCNITFDVISLAQKTQIPITMNVIRKYILLHSVVEQFGYYNDKSKVPIKFTVKQNVKSRGSNINFIVVHDIANVTTYADITHMKPSEKKISFYVVYEQRSSIPITMYVNAIGHLITNSDVINHVSNKLDIHMTIPIVKRECNITFYVSTEKTAPKILAPAKLAKPQLAKENIKALKDTYGYNFARYMNYGLKQKIVVANTKKYDIFKTIIGFDYKDLNIDMKRRDAQYYGYQTVQKAILNLNVISGIKTGDIVKVYSIDNNWVETFANYNTIGKQNIGKLITQFTVPNKLGRIKIDITDDLKDFELLPSTQRSYLLVIEQHNKRNNDLLTFSSLQTKLGEMAKPSVTVTYWHTPPNCEWFDIPITFEVNPQSRLPVNFEVTLPDHSDKLINFEINPYKVQRDICNIKFEVITDQHYNDLDIKLDIIKYPCDEHGTNIKLLIPNTVVWNDSEKITMFIERHPEKEMYVYLL